MYERELFLSVDQGLGSVAFGGVLAFHIDHIKAYDVSFVHTEYSVLQDLLDDMQESLQSSNFGLFLA